MLTKTEYNMKNKHLFLIIILMIIGGALIIDFGLIATGVVLLVLGFFCLIFFPLLSDYINEK